MSLLFQHLLLEIPHLCPTFPLQPVVFFCFFPEKYGDENSNTTDCCDEQCKPSHHRNHLPEQIDHDNRHGNQIHSGRIPVNSQLCLIFFQAKLCIAPPQSDCRRIGLIQRPLGTARSWFKDARNISSSPIVEHTSGSVRKSPRRLKSAKGSQALFEFHYLKCMPRTRPASSRLSGRIVGVRSTDSAIAWMPVSRLVFPNRTKTPIRQ